MFAFFHTFSVLWKSTFPMFWELDGFLPHTKKLRNPQVWNVCAFLNFSLTMGIHFYHILVIVWISASPKYLRNPNFEKSVFFRIFSLLWEFTFPIFWKLYGLMPQIYTRSIALKCLCFPIRFPYYENSVFPCFQNCVGFY